MSALIALIHMAAECSRAAVPNGFEGLSLPGTENASPLRKEFPFVFAEDIGHFQPMPVHHFGGVS